MEDASKAIEIAVGIIIFVIALTLTILIYSNLNKTIENAVTINSTTTSVVTGGIENIGEEHIIVYDESEIFFMIQDMIRKADVNAADYSYDKYSSYSYWKEDPEPDPNKKPIKKIEIRNIDDSIHSTYNSGANDNEAVLQFIEAMRGMDGKYLGFKNTFAGKKYTIEYVYSYQEIERLNIANHSITQITFRQLQ